MSGKTPQEKINALWPSKSSIPLHQDEANHLKNKIKSNLKQYNAKIIAHYYVDPEIQKLAEETGGVVADSLEMAKFGARSEAQTLIVAGVKFMGETAKILSPEKRILMPTLEATCSLDISCPVDEFKAFCAKHPDRTVVVYANTSADVKACADWVVTSSIALDVVTHLHDNGEKILWAPDRFLGSYIEKHTGADMIHWQGACVVHEEFKAKALKQMIEMHPEAGVLVHPESPLEVVELADVAGSTSQLLKASVEMDNDTFIVGTDMGIVYKMQQASPNKTFIAAPTGGEGATCRSCAHCPWMGMNHLQNLSDTLEQGLNEIYLDESTRQGALKPLERMVNFSNTTLV